MTATEMDDACRLARHIVDENYILPADEHLIARALLAAVGERDALRDLCAVLNSDGGHMQVADGAVAAVEAALDRWYALQARVVAAEQHAEALTAERDMLRVEIDDAAYTEAAAILRYQRAEKAITTERARVVEAIAAFVGAMSMRHRPWTFDEMAKAIRSHNWAAPEEES